MKLSRFIFSLCLVLCAVGVLAAQNVPGPRKIIVTLRGNAVIVGNLIRLDPDKLEMVGENSIRVIDVDDIISITFDQGQGNSSKASHNNSAEAMLATKNAPAQQQGTPQAFPPDPPNVPRGYSKVHDRPSRRGAREAASKLEDATGEKPENSDGNGNENGNSDINNNGAGNNDNNNPPDADEEARIAAERAAKERLLERARAERLVREKANRERAARERAEREKRERAAKAEKARKERSERAERDKKEMAEKARKEKEAKERDKKDSKTAQGKDKNKRADDKAKNKTAQEKKPEPRKKRKN